MGWEGSLILSFLVVLVLFAIMGAIRRFIQDEKTMEMCHRCEKKAYTLEASVESPRSPCTCLRHT